MWAAAGRHPETAVQSRHFTMMAELMTAQREFVSDCAADRERLVARQEELLDTIAHQHEQTQDASAAKSRHATQGASHSPDTSPALTPDICKERDYTLLPSDRTVRPATTRSSRTGDRVHTPSSLVNSENRAIYTLRGSDTTGDARRRG